MHKLIIILFFIGTLFAQTYPEFFSQLSTPLYRTTDDFKKLENVESFHRYHKQLQHYQLQALKLKEDGFALDAKTNKDTKGYLKALRQLQKEHDIIQNVYKHKLYKSINENNATAFYLILNVPLAFVSNDARLKKEVVSFYQKNKTHKVPYLEDLSKDFALDERSYTYANSMFKVQQKNQKVKTRKRLKDFIPYPLRKPPVEVIMIKTAKGYDLYLENHAYYQVSILFKALKIKNLQASVPLPYQGSFEAQTRTKFLSFKIKDPKKESYVQTTYATQMGRLNPDYDKDYLYALPYKRDKAYRLSQGFNTSSTHKGQSAYALDFEMPIGTRIHAMREGRVVAIEDKNTQHGFSPKFLHKSNYIIIEHKDGSLGMYGHLKPNGVKVKLGQMVYKHQFIGLSGNTGYSSGPHLHVHIGIIKDFSSGLSSVPFSFKTSRGKVSKPVERSSYLCN